MVKDQEYLSEKASYCLDLAKKLGAKKTIIIVNNYTYINILPKNFVDIALSPQRLTVSMVLQHLAKGDVPQEVIFKMQSGAEAIEGIIHKNKFKQRNKKQICF